MINVDDGNEEDKLDDSVIVDLIEYDALIDVAFIDNFNVANKVPTDSEEQIRQSATNFAPSKGYESLPLAKKDRSVIQIDPLLLFPNLYYNFGKQSSMRHSVQ